MCRRAVYIDPTDITLTRADLVALVESIGAGATEYDAFNHVMKKSLSGLPAPLVAEATVISGLLDSDLERRGLPPQPRIPASVIIAGRVGIPPQGGLPFDTAAYAKAMHESQVRRLRAWVSEGGTFEVVTNSGHSVHVDDPAHVINAIRHLVEGTRGLPFGVLQHDRCDRERVSPPARAQRRIAEWQGNSC
jgi:hypothetical protein